MRARLVFTCLGVWIGMSALAVTTGVGCSSSSSGGGTVGEEGGSKSDGSGSSSGSASSSGSSSSSSSGGSSSGTASSSGGGGDAGAHDAPAADALYGCATQGSFGWTCTATASGPDPTDCTDPAFPDCFVGGQGAWCTKVCTSGADCTNTEVGGCTPSGCNSKGYCK